MYTKLVLLLSHDGQKLEKKIVKGGNLVPYEEAKHNIHPKLEMISNLDGREKIIRCLRLLKDEMVLEDFVSILHNILSHENKPSVFPDAPSNRLLELDEAIDLLVTLQENEVKVNLSERPKIVKI